MGRVIRKSTGYELMTNTKLVSIIVPIYNVEKYLSQCLDSIISQSYSNIEIILIDDGSSDNSSSILDEYKRIDSRIIILSKKNQGVSSARNAGLDVARGEFITFIDPDDWYCQDAIEYAVNNISDHDVINFNYKRFYEDTGGISKNHFQYENLGTINIKYNLQSLGWAVWHKMFRRDIIGDIRFNTNVYFAEDLLFVWRILSQQPKVLMSNKTGLYYRIHTGSISNKKKYDSSFQINAIEIIKEMRRFSEGDVWKKYYFHQIIHHLRKEVKIRNAPLDKLDKYIRCHFVVGSYLIYASMVYFSKKIFKTLRFIERVRVKYKARRSQ